MENSNPLKNFLEIPYDELEAMNLEAGEKAKKLKPEQLEKEYQDYLRKEKRVKAVTICFSDIEGRLHMLDYDKNFLLRSAGNLTFDGSSIRGFSALHESDLRLELDWPSFRWLPSDVFGPGKVVLFAFVQNRDRSLYSSDFRGRLKEYCDKIKKENGITGYISAEVEGFLVDGKQAEQNYSDTNKFKLISSGGYYHSLPLGRLRNFIDRAAEAQRAMGFRNEKDHPEVAPSQFELNFTYEDALKACDMIQLYKLVCRQVANNMDMTATFLPKPTTQINGSGMHLNFSLFRDNKNIFYEKDGKDGLSQAGWDAISRVLNHAPELCLILNSSVNAYRRLDPKFEAPNQIKVSSIDRGSMIRIPIGDEKSTRLEIRSVAPDSNPYLVVYSILKTAMEGKKLKKDKDKRDRLRFLPDNINDAIKIFKASDYITDILSEDDKAKYVGPKQSVADRSPKELGTTVKTSEIIFHHEVTNQMLWNRF
ncbi:MAG: glutamine synthetase family protein [Candidatus Moranbacteria bacterium]|nr:glutamine synthetase family protein [Candidatus Moranbacteria bacterium]